MDYRDRFMADSGPFPEAEFQKWYAQRAAQTGIDANPDDPRHFYNYRQAYAAGAEPSLASDQTYHWPSRHKLPQHPNRFIPMGDGSILDSLLDQRLP